MRKKLTNSRGFTLVELVVTLTLIGILASVAGLGIAWSMRSYTTTRENVAISQKAQLALMRIQKELSALSGIILDTTTNSSDDTCIIYKARPLSTSNAYRIIRYNSSRDELEYLSDATCLSCDCTAGGNTLADNIGSASILYKAIDGTDITPGGGTYSADDIGSIKVTFGFTRTDGGAPHTFSVTVSPRNNGNLNAPGFAS